MSEHRIAPNGVCQNCGAHKPEHVAAPCTPRVVYLPSSHTVQDFMNPEGLTWFGRKTFEQCREEHADAVLMDADEAYALRDSAFIKPVSETTAERFDYALCVLPPGKWTGPGGRESFYVTERITGNIVDWYARHDDRFFTLTDRATLGHREVMARVAEFIAANPRTEVVPA